MWLKCLVRRLWVKTRGGWARSLLQGVFTCSEWVYLWREGLPVLKGFTCGEGVYPRSAAQQSQMFFRENAGERFALQRG
ncbi:hypothetical protein FBY12_4393 [Pseudomonas sp. SJZ131]|nr:hypothetical protein FBY12_4393 [Pseudomonas sp. SJZ131]